MPTSDDLQRRLLSNTFAERLRDEGAIDEVQWEQLMSDLNILAAQ
jgi:hypothetical protein